MTFQAVQKTGDNIRLYHTDHLGSTALVTDIDGEVTQHVAYIPYGEIFVEQRNGSWNTPYLFNAKELDEETGLYYYGARYLDPTNVTWMSVDPLFEKYVGMTPYGYCAGNPVRLVDPDGRDAKITINEEQGTITVTSNIIIYGSLANEEMANVYKKSIMNSWGKMNTYEYEGRTYNVMWNIDVRVKGENEKENYNGVNNYIKVVNSTANPSSTINTNNGSWRGVSYSGDVLDENSKDNPAPHEFGHILGLRDRYVTKTQSQKSGWEYGMSLKGWNGNVMGEKAGQGKVSKENLDILFTPSLKLHKWMIELYEKYFPSSSRFFPYDNKSYNINGNHREPEFDLTPKPKSK